MKEPVFTPRRRPHIPDLMEYDEMMDRWQVIDDFCAVLQEDFVRACEEQEENDSQYARRVVVRCFGSAIDGFAACMREAAIGAAKLWGKPLNPFLTEKVRERDTSAYHRIVTSYRLICEFMPTCPLARVGDDRWRKLHTALTLRNRVVHPTKAEDLKIADPTKDKNEFGDLVDSLTELMHDFEAFWVWFFNEMQRRIEQLGARSQRLYRKIGRNEPCPCGRKAKFKDCCGRPTTAE